MPGTLQAATRPTQERRKVRSCPLCGSSSLELFFRASSVPIDLNVLWLTRREALDCPRGDIELGFCRKCGAITNVAFEPDQVQYNGAYDNSLHFSPAFQQYARALAEDLVHSYDLHHKVVVEIGCGQGEFLALLCQLGNNRGIGFDPAYVGGRVDSQAGEGIEFVRSFFTESQAVRRCDFICCRHVLEHVLEAKELLANVRRALAGSPQATVFFEVPNALFTLRDKGIWDIIYPHYSYFSPASLRWLFASCGFEVLALREGFGGQFLGIEASPARTQRACNAPAGSELRAVCEAVAEFGINYARQVEQLERTLNSLACAGRRVILWGAGAKGVTFLNKFGRLGHIEYAVDVNPYKHGKFVSGSGQEIVAPDFLKEYRPDAIVITNANYRHEIGRQLREFGLQPEFILA
jgi:SAM-dependent methyltransferase